VKSLVLVEGFCI